MSHPVGGQGIDIAGERSHDQSVECRSGGRSADISAEMLRSTHETPTSRVGKGGSDGAIRQA